MIRSKYMKYLLLVLSTVPFMLFPNFFDSSNSILAYAPNIFLILTIIFASVYGLFLGIFSSIYFSIIYFMFLNFSALHEEIESLFEIRFIIFPAAMIILGTILGEMKERYLREKRESKELIDKNSKIIEGLRIEINKVSSENSKISKKLASYLNSPYMLLETFMEMLDFNKEKTINLFYELIKKLTPVNSFSLYFKKNSAFCLASSDKDSNFCLASSSTEFFYSKEFNSAKLSDTDIVTICLTRKEPVTIKDLYHSKIDLSSYKGPLVAIPIMDQSRNVTGLFLVSDMPIDALVTDNINLLNIACMLLSRLLIQINKYWNSQYYQLSQKIPGTYSLNYLDTFMLNYKKIATNYKAPLNIIVISFSNLEHVGNIHMETLFTVFSNIINKHLSTFDKLFITNTGRTWFVICPLQDLAYVDKTKQKIEKEMNEVLALAKTKGEDLSFTAKITDNIKNIAEASYE